MQQTKALYNQLRLLAQEDPTVKVEPWVLEDMRAMSVDEIFGRLDKEGIRLDRQRFLQFAEESDSPEQIDELLDDEGSDYVYLLLFELWRRLLPERASLSIFCDELDHLIVQYYKEELTTDEPIQDALANLSEILEEHVDEGVTVKKAFENVSEYCASDLEVFLYDYISELLDQDNTIYAQELIEEFGPYLAKALPFVFLQARLADAAEVNGKIKEILAKKPELSLLFDILWFLVSAGEHDTFQAAMAQALPQVSSEDEAHEAIDISAEYYRRLDKDEIEQAILRLKGQSESHTETVKKLATLIE